MVRCLASFPPESVCYLMRVGGCVFACAARLVVQGLSCFLNVFFSPIRSIVSIISLFVL